MLHAIYENVINYTPAAAANASRCCARADDATCAWHFCVSSFRMNTPCAFIQPQHASGVRSTLAIDMSHCGAENRGDHDHDVDNANWQTVTTARAAHTAFSFHSHSLAVTASATGHRTSQRPGARCTHAPHKCHKIRINSIYSRTCASFAHSALGAVSLSFGFAICSSRTSARAARSRLCSFNLICHRGQLNCTPHTHSTRAHICIHT